MLQTIQKAVRVLELFTSERPEWGVSEAAKALGFPKSNTSMLISTLAEQGLLRRTGGGRYRLGWRLMYFSQTLLDTADFRAEARRAMEHLVSRFGELTHLAALESSQVVYVDKVESTRTVRVATTGLGYRLPAHCSGVGKVLLAHHPWEEVVQITERQGMPALTPNTIITLDELQRELENVRIRGYAYDIEEAVPELCCVAAPIRDHSGEVAAALSFSVPAYRFHQGRDRYRAAIVETAKKISENLGYCETRKLKKRSVVRPRGLATDRLKAAIVGSGNIGSDLMYKLLKDPGHMQLKMLAGIDPDSEGLKRAKELGIETTAEGIGPVLEDEEIKLVFDATSAKAHVRHAKILKEAGKIAIDLTPAARGPYVVPIVNLTEHLDKDNVNLMTCGAQATTPMAYAVSRVTPVAYAEMVSTVASLSAGPGTRQNIDEFTVTTAKGLEEIGDAKRGKAIIILNPADPPIMMRNTVYVVPEGDFDEEEVVKSVNEMVAAVQEYVPGYHLKSEPVFDEKETPWGRKKIVVLLVEVEGAGDFLPKYAGNLDIMTSAARGVGEQFARHLLRSTEEVVA